MAWQEGAFLGSAEGLVKACKYAFVPNELGYCGARNFNELFKRFISSPSEKLKVEVKKALRSFTALYSYLSLISEYASKDVFDESVVEAYWLGNSLLEKIPVQAVKELISEKFVVLPSKIRKEKASFLARKVYIHHSFHVLFIQFLTPKLKPLLTNMDKCIVKWGKILEIKNDKLRVKSVSLLYEGAELKLKENYFFIKKGFIEEPYKGMLISIHWENAIEEISRAQAKEVEKYLLANISLANSYAIQKTNKK